MGRSLWIAVFCAVALGCSAKSQPVQDVPDLLPDAGPPPATSAEPGDGQTPAEASPEVAEIERAAKALENCRPEPVGAYENCTEWEEWSRRRSAWFDEKDRD